MTQGPELFIGIGAQKAGTTWVGKYLSDHAQVGFSPIKELHYFDAMYLPEYFGSRNEKAWRTLRDLIDQLEGNPTAEQAELIRCYALRLEMISDESRYLDYFRLVARPEHVVVGEITPAYAALDEKAFAQMKRLTGTQKVFIVLRDPVDRL